MINYLVMGMALLLSIVNWFSEAYGNRIERYHARLVSFSAGLFITFIFLRLMPEFFEGMQHTGRGIFLLMLAGFVFFHVLEKYVYQHVKNKKELLKDLAEVHAGGFFLDHFVVGMALYLTVSQADLPFGTLIFLPLLMHIISSSLTLNHLDKHFESQKIILVLLSGAPFLGALFAFLLNPEKNIYYAMFSFVIGALLYIVVRDMIPYGKKGRLGYFLAGMFVNLALLVMVGVIANAPV